MLRKDRGKADGPIYTIQICIPKHGQLRCENSYPSFSSMFLSSLPRFLSWPSTALNLIFSFTNGVDWDGPYRLQFLVPKPLQNKPIDFFNQVKGTFQIIRNLYIFMHVLMHIDYMFNIM